MNGERLQGRRTAGLQGTKEAREKETSIEFGLAANKSLSLKNSMASFVYKIKCFIQPS